MQLKMPAEIEKSSELYIMSCGSKQHRCARSQIVTAPKLTRMSTWLSWKWRIWMRKRAPGRIGATETADSTWYHLKLKLRGYRIRVTWVAIWVDQYKPFLPSVEKIEIAPRQPSVIQTKTSERAQASAGGPSATEREAALAGKMTSQN